MKFADSLYQLYCRHFNQKEHLPVFIYSVLEQFKQEDLKEIIEQLPKEELENILASYFIDTITEKYWNNQLNSSPQSELQKWQKIH